MMTFREYRCLIFADLYRITGRISILLLLRCILRGRAYAYIFWMRTCRFTKGLSFFKYVLYPPARLMLHHYKYKLGIAIPLMTSIGHGFYIGHFGGIIISGGAEIGKNCNISQGVTIGQVNRGAYKGSPVLGDNVYIAPGAKIIGAISIGNNVAIGANCVVTKNIPDNSVVVGVPGKIISQKGSEGYINNTDYEDKFF